LKSSSDSSATAFRCSNCGAPLEVSPETIVAVCSYCGYPNWIREDLKSEIYIVRSAREEDAAAAARKYLGGSYTYRSLQLYIPLYIVDARADADYEALTLVRVRKCERDRRGEERCTTRSFRIHVSGYLSGYRGRYPVIARKGVRGKTVEALAKHLLSSGVAPSRLEEMKLDRVTARSILVVDLSRDEARDAILDRHLNSLRRAVESEIRSRAAAKASIHGVPVSVVVLWKRVTPTNVAVDVSPPILAPLYIFTDESNRYKAVLAGWDLKPLIVEKPVGLAYRALWMALGTLSAGIFGGLAGAALQPGGPSIVLSTALLILGGAASWYSAKKALRPVRVVVKV